jgi:hypothetical protein
MKPKIQVFHKIHALYLHNIDREVGKYKNKAREKKTVRVSLNFFDIICNRFLFDICCYGVLYRAFAGYS